MKYSITVSFVVATWCYLVCNIMYLTNSYYFQQCFANKHNISERCYR